MKITFRTQSALSPRQRLDLASRFVATSFPANLVIDAPLEPGRDEIIQNYLRDVIADENHPVRERFWRHVNKTDSCWLWKLSRSKKYGEFSVGTGKYEKKIRAHAFSLMLHHGSDVNVIYSEHVRSLYGIQQNVPCVISHRCHTHKCVRPDHLQLATYAENSNHSFIDGKIGRGADHPNAALSHDDRMMIVNLRYLGWSHQRIASSMGCARSTVGEILEFMCV